MLTDRARVRTHQLHERRGARGTLVLDRYRLESERGGTDAGALHDAVELTTGRGVSIEIADGLDHDDERVTFLRDARIAQRLEGEHVLRVVEAGSLPDGTPFVVREAAFTTVEREIATNGPVSPEQAVAWTLEATEAIAEAHALGMAHGDLGPHSVMLARSEEGPLRVKVAWTTTAKAQGRAREDLTRDLQGLGRLLRALTSGVLRDDDEALSADGARTLPNGIAHVVARALVDGPGAYPHVGELAEDLAPLAPSGHEAARNIAFLLWQAGIERGGVQAKTVPVAPRPTAPTDPHEHDPVQPTPWLGEDDEVELRPSATPPRRRGLWLAAIAVALAIAAVASAYALRDRGVDMTSELGLVAPPVDVAPWSIAPETVALAERTTAEGLWSFGAALPAMDASAERELARVAEDTEASPSAGPGPREAPAQAPENGPSPLGAPDAPAPFDLGGIDI